MVMQGARLAFERANVVSFALSFPAAVALLLFLCLSFQHFLNMAPQNAAMLLRWHRPVQFMH